MSERKNKSSVSTIVFKNGVIVGYLSSRDEENGRDVSLDLQGYTILAL